MALSVTANVINKTNNNIIPSITYEVPGGTPAITSVTGVYCVIDKRVDFTVSLNGINVDTSTGIVTIHTNIPSAFSASLAAGVQTMSVFVDNVALNKSDKHVQARFINGTTQITIGEMGGSGPDIFDPYDAADVDGASIAISGTYFM